VAGLRNACYGVIHPLELELGISPVANLTRRQRQPSYLNLSVSEGNIAFSTCSCFFFDRPIDNRLNKENSLTNCKELSLLEYMVNVFL
jgi:hypothetical protein